MKCIFDFTSCSIPEGYTKHIGLFNIFLIIIIIVFLGFLIKSKLFIICGIIIFLFLLFILVNSLLNNFILPNLKKPKKIKTKYKHLLMYE